MLPHESKVAVALSGGVDSAVAAALLQQQAIDLSGVHLRLSPQGPPAGHLALLGERLGLRLEELDLQADFARQVLDYFVEEYFRGRTPNPCLRCNATIKFGRLWQHLEATGATHLATGHYARLQKEADGALGLYRGVDRRKDQSYFLSRLPRELLPHLLFPLGELTKPEVRQRYRDLGLPPGADDRESMELCFVPDGGYQAFIRQRRGAPGPPGDLVDSRGRVLGRHRGLEAYTVGQRRGLGIPAREPFYVTAIQPELNRVVLGQRAELLASGLLASRMNWLITPPVGELEAQAVIRYRHPGVPALIIPLEGGGVRVVFATPQAAVAPGQGVVFYHQDRVLGGGWIEARIK